MNPPVDADVLSLTFPPKLKGVLEKGFAIAVSASLVTSFGAENPKVVLELVVLNELDPAPKGPLTVLTGLAKLLPNISKVPFFD